MKPPVLKKTTWFPLGAKFSGESGLNVPDAELADARSSHDGMFPPDHAPSPSVTPSSKEPLRMAMGCTATTIDWRTGRRRSIRIMGESHAVPRESGGEFTPARTWMGSTLRYPIPGAPAG